MVKCQEKETQEKNNCQLTANTERIIKSVYIFLNAFKKKGSSFLSQLFASLLRQ